MSSAFVVTTSSGYEGEGRREIRKILSPAKVRKLFFKGNLYVETEMTQEAAIKALREVETYYIGRIYPVSSEISINASRDSIESIYTSLSKMDGLTEEDTFRVNCTRRGSHDFSSRDIEVTVGRRLEEETGAVVDLENPCKTVVVQVFQDTVYLGVTPTEHLLVKKIRRFRKYPRGERPFTRAEFKLREALKAFSLEVEADFEVLDIGAAPGGWTKTLAGMAGRVVAVDPADLHPSLREMPNVVHIRSRAEDLPEDIGEFDLLTNDMNISPRESAEVMNALSGRLKEGAAAIMTVKFVTRARRRHIREASEILEERYEDIRVRRMPHNRNEATLYMRKK